MRVGSSAKAVRQSHRVSGTVVEDAVSSTHAGTLRWSGRSVRTLRRSRRLSAACPALSGKVLRRCFGTGGATGRRDGKAKLRRGSVEDERRKRHFDGGQVSGRRSYDSQDAIGIGGAEEKSPREAGSDEPAAGRVLRHQVSAVLEEGTACCVGAKGLAGCPQNGHRGRGENPEGEQSPREHRAVHRGNAVGSNGLGHGARPRGRGLGEGAKRAGGDTGAGGEFTGWKLEGRTLRWSSGRGKAPGQRRGGNGCGDAVRLCTRERLCRV